MCCPVRNWDLAKWVDYKHEAKETTGLEIAKPLRQNGASIRGGTGCQYYRHEDRVRQYVTRYEPDLVMIANYAKSNNISTEEAAAVRGAFLDDVKKLAGEEKVESIPLKTPRMIETQWNMVVS